MRKENQDHFLIAALHKQMVVQDTSLPPDVHLPVEPERLASLAMVADAKADLPELPPAQRGALELVADGVVDRYS